MVQSQNLTFGVIKIRVSLYREARVGTVKRLNTLPKSAKVMHGISIALTPVEASGMSTGRMMAKQVNGLEMLVAEGGFRALPKGMGA